MDVEVLPAIGEGQETQKREILALRNGVPGDQVPEADRSVKAAPWCDVLRAELARKNGIETQAAPMRQLQDMLALALEPLGNRVPFALYTMKQFRDCSQPDRACYQSLLRVSRSLEEVYDVREIEEPLVLRIHEFPTQPIVSLLGLVAQNVTGPDMGISWELQPIRPFAVRATMKEAEGVRLLDHVGAHRWHIDGDENDADDRHDKDCNGDEIPYLRTGPISRSERASSGESTRATLAGLQRRHTNSRRSRVCTRNASRRTTQSRRSTPSIRRPCSRRSSHVSGATPRTLAGSMGVARSRRHTGGGSKA